MGTNGLRVFQLPLGISGTMSSLVWHRRLFEKDTMVEANMALIQQYLDIDFIPRKQPQYINLNTSLVHSGDTLAIQAPMFANGLIAVGTGASIGHTAIAVWKTQSDGTRQLFVCESTDVCEDPGPIDFPPPYGQVCRPWDLWMKQAYEAGFWVNLCPLKPEYSSKFNEKAAWDFINAHMGQEYGYANFIYTFLDMSNNLNFPHPVTDLLLEMGIGNVDRLMQDLHEPSNPKYTITTFLTLAMNQRLTHFANQSKVKLAGIPWKDGFVNCPDWKCVWQAVDQFPDTTMWDFLTFPEQDGWLYPNSKTGVRDWTSEVCDVYATNVLKHAGVFGNLDFNAHEFTPRDLFSLNIYQDDPSWKPASCNQVPGDEKVGHCQLMGAFTNPLVGYASRKPHPHMYDHCGAAKWNNDYAYSPENC